MSAPAADAPVKCDLAELARRVGGVDGSFWIRAERGAILGGFQCTCDVLFRRIESEEDRERFAPFDAVMRPVAVEEARADGGLAGPGISVWELTGCACSASRPEGR